MHNKPALPHSEENKGEKSLGLELYSLVQFTSNIKYHLHNN